MQQLRSRLFPVRSFFLCCCLALLPLACTSRPEPNKKDPYDSSRPITSSRLVGAKLEAIDGSHAWTFADKTFVLVAEEAKIPADLLKTLLGTADDTAQVQGKWELDAANGMLLLTDMTTETSKEPKKARLTIGPAGTLRANLGKYQYNIFPGKS